MNIEAIMKTAILLKQFAQGDVSSGLDTWWATGGFTMNWPPFGLCGGIAYFINKANGEPGEGAAAVTIGAENRIHAESIFNPNKGQWGERYQWKTFSMSESDLDALSIEEMRSKEHRAKFIDSGPTADQTAEFLADIASGVVYWDGSTWHDVPGKTRREAIDAGFLRMVA